VSLEALAATQHGLLTRAQAREAGLSPFQIERRVQGGRWSSLNRQVVAIAGAPSTWEQSVLAAVLAGGPGAVASHATAARLYRLPGFEDAPTELTTSLGRRVRVDGIVAHRSGTLFDADVRTVRRIPTTAPARLVVDLSSRLDPGPLGVVLDELLRRRMVSLWRVADCIGRLGRAPGRSPKTVREVLAARWPGYDPGESTLETRVLRLLADAGLPLPRQQHRVVVDGRRYRVDLAYPELLVAIECDGFRWHAQRSDWDRDLRRQNDLVRTGWRVLRITAAMSDEEILDAVRRTVGAAPAR
jgi:very-short-patch-repair endonuclease